MKEPRKFAMGDILMVFPGVGRSSVQECNVAAAEAKA